MRLATAIDPTTGGAVIYAATGVAQNDSAANPGVGVLLSINGGRTWTVLGGANGSGPGVFTGLRW